MFFVYVSFHIFTSFAFTKKKIEKKQKIKNKKQNKWWSK